MADFVERWDVFEVQAAGPAEGNPFVEQWFRGVFRGQGETVAVDGFYDGDGVYKVRFMPSFVGEYTYETEGSFPGAAGAGSFVVTPAGEGNHGPVRVANTYHFAYEDGTPYYSVGTTCYVWPHQPEEVIEKDPGGAGQGVLQQDAVLRVPQALHPQLQRPSDLPL